jgi:hypothetical protein
MTVALGYPQADANVRDYLATAPSAKEVEERTTQFFIALFDQLVQQNPATPSELQTFLGYGDQTRARQRKNFFEEVIEVAKGVMYFCNWLYVLPADKSRFPDASRSGDASSIRTEPFYASGYDFDR